MQRKSNENGDRVIEDSGRFDRDIEDSGRVSTCVITSSGSVRLRISSNLYLRITVLEMNCEWLILCVVNFFSVLLTSERCFVCDLVLTECVVRV